MDLSINVGYFAPHITNDYKLIKWFNNTKIYLQPFSLIELLYNKFKTNKNIYMY